MWKYQNAVGLNVVSTVNICFDGIIICDRRM